jgi:hypothetical protein
MKLNYNPDGKPVFRRHNDTCRKCEKYEERCAIIEHDGGLDRADAELAAMLDVCTDCEHRYGA